ncbi:hypothetical protein NDU88_001694 [Pleurodeles waltl]|uniref:Uncharacterized protein n=1 Tax=Pleurodeles waltl TaxID=8319 RepID=A0AAV7MPG9_PLEWA|nr:hypothetical protein NDU88_001694 [Pleurodeles waltl]
MLNTPSAPIRTRALVSELHIECRWPEVMQGAQQEAGLEDRTRARDAAQQELEDGLGGGCDIAAALFY